MFSLPAENWYRLVIWMAIGLVIYFTYSQRHSELRKRQEANDRIGARAAGALR